MAQFIIDGYNLLQSTELFRGGTLRDQRERLLRFIEGGRSGGSRRRVTVVFDGRSDVTAPRWPGPARVIFSVTGNADQVIKDAVDRLPRPQDAVVVTNDRAIHRWVRGVGARVISCASFLEAAAPRARARPVTARRVSGLSDRPLSSLDPAVAREITDEMGKRWM